MHQIATQAFDRRIRVDDKGRALEGFRRVAGDVSDRDDRRVVAIGQIGRQS